MHPVSVRFIVFCDALLSVKRDDCFVFAKQAKQMGMSESRGIYRKIPRPRMPHDTTRTPREYSRIYKISWDTNYNGLNDILREKIPRYQAFSLLFSVLGWMQTRKGLAKHTFIYAYEILAENSHIRVIQLT